VTQAAPAPFILIRGDGRVVVSVPHAGIFIPPDIAARLTPIGRANHDADWHVDRLYDFAAEAGATVIVATHARIAADLNRDPAGGRLYPGQAETGICPTETFDGEPYYAGAPPNAAEIAARIEAFWRPYHDALAAELARVKSQHGEARLLDGHSIRQSVPRLFPGKLPDLNFGTNGSQSAAPELVARAVAATEGQGFSQVLDGRFRGGYITRHYGCPAHCVHAIQLEIAQTTYLDEASPETFDPARAADLIRVLRRLVEALLRA
jgi:N-formylglutamate amidohydrolase